MNVINEGEFTIIEDVLPKESIEGFENIVIPHLNYSMGENYKGTSGISNDFFDKHGVKNIYEQFQFYNLVFSNRERDFQKDSDNMGSPNTVPGYRRQRQSKKSGSSLSYGAYTKRV